MSNDREVIYDPLHELMARFENVKAVDTSVDPFEGLSVEDSLKKHIIDGVKKNLERRLEAGLQQYEPLQIINEILLDGMKTVGELFGAGKMQLPFVLQSAEVMKRLRGLKRGLFYLRQSPEMCMILARILLILFFRTMAIEW
jgi:5-methyltetrahydrofolate--homocysteine methyltransferase